MIRRIVAYFQKLERALFVSIALIVSVIYLVSTVEIAGLMDPLDDILEALIFLAIVVPFLYVKLKRDLVVRSKSEYLIREKETYYQSLFKYNPDPTYQLDLEWNFIEINGAAERLLGVARNDIVGASFTPFIRDDDLERTLQFFSKVVQGESVTLDIEMMNRQQEPLSVNVTAAPIIVENRVLGIIGVAKNVTEKVKTEKKMLYMAYHDPLTGLPNRILFKELLKKSLLNAKRFNHSVAVMFIDLDRFKFINDAYGHSMGDVLLKAVGQRIRSCLRDSDTVSRYGGDEFTVLLERIHSEEEIKIVADRILHSLSEPFTIQDTKVHISPSIGISLSAPELEMEELIQQADSAMYYVKRNGKSGYMMFSLLTQAPFLIREKHVRRGLENNEFTIVYQPQINIHTGDIIGVEALLRWKHPKLGWIPPTTFIPVAEESFDLMESLGSWVLLHACKQLKQWQEIGLRELTISINLSIKQLQKPGIVEVVSSILSEIDLEPRYVDLEITESLTMDHQYFGEVLTKLRDLGVKLSIDDFGTGFSSLSYLRDLPVNRLKIARPFVKDLELNYNDKAIIASIISLAQNLNLQVIAEGVETKEQFQFLQEKGCNEIQGYYISQPLPPEEFEHRFRGRGQVAFKA